MKPTAPGIQDCPGLKITANAGIFFTDCLQRVHDMEQQVWRTPIEAAGDVRKGDLVAFVPFSEFGLGT